MCHLGYSAILTFSMKYMINNLPNKLLWCLCTCKLWNYLSTSKELFLLIYDLNGFKPRVKVPGGEIKLFLDVIRMFISTVSFLNSRIICLHQRNSFLWSRVYKYLIGFLVWFSFMASSFFCNSMPCNGCLDLLEKKKKKLRRMGEAQQNYHTIKWHLVTMRRFPQGLGQEK